MFGVETLPFCIQRPYRHICTKTSVWYIYIYTFIFRPRKRYVVNVVFTFAIWTHLSWKLMVPHHFEIPAFRKGLEVGRNHVAKSSPFPWQEGKTCRTVAGGSGRASGFARRTSEVLAVFLKFTPRLAFRWPQTPLAIGPKTHQMQHPFRVLGVNHIYGDLLRYFLWLEKLISFEYSWRKRT